MKLQFKEQDFQVQAAKAIVDCFKGQWCAQSLPKTFIISTNVANHSPDWAIVFDKDKVRHIYFVAETKSSDSDMDLREIEKQKIHFKTEHFKGISGNEVRFERVSSYDKLLEIVKIN